MSAIPVSPVKRKQILRVIFISLLLDLISFTFILPLFPKLLEFYRKLEAQDDSSSLLNRILLGLNTYKRSFSRPISDRYDIVLLGGALGSLFSLLQAVASPIIGILSDKYGRRTALLWSMAGNIASVALWVAATDFRTFLASRVVGGLSEGNVQLATAMAADISDDKQRGATMAMVGVCFSIAFTFGPALGAALANIEIAVANPFATAAGFSLFLILAETVYLYFYLPETLPSSRVRPATNGSILKTGSEQQKHVRTNSHKLLNFTHFVFILFFSGMEFSLPFMTYDLFAYTSSQSGKLLGFMGLIASVLQGSVTRRLHPLRVVQLGVVACAASFFMLGRLTTEAGLWGAAMLLAVTTATVVTGLNSLSSFEAAEGERGEKMGNHRSWGQVGRSCGPLLFCTLYWWAGRDVAYAVGGADLVLEAFTMAQVVQNGTIDLTGEDDDDNCTTRANSVYEEAVAKASRITSLFESNKTTRPLPYQNPSKSPDKQGSSGEKNTFHASSPKPLAHSRLKTFPNLARYESNGLTKDENRDGIPRQGTIPRKHSTNCSTNVWFPQSPLATATQKPAKPFPVLEEEEENRRQPRQITFATPRNGASNIRTPRSAALSAKQNIAETCNELEEWITKDPDLLPQQAAFSSPKKPGRPKKDSDEWSPSSNTKNIMEQQNGLGGSITITSALSARGSGDLAVSKDDNLSLSKGVSTLVGNKKRKLSGSSLSNDSPVKSAKLNAEPGGRQGDCLPRLAESASRSMYTKEYVTNLLGGCFPKCVYPAIKAAKEQYKNSLTDDELNGIANSIINDIVDQGVEVFCPASANCPTDQRTEIILNFVSANFHERALGSKAEQAFGLEPTPSNKSAIETNNKLLSKPPNADSGENDKSTKSTTLHMPEMMDPKLQQGCHEASDPTASEPGLSSVSPVLVRFATLFESVVFPAIRKSRKRFKDSLSQRDLDVIDKTIVNDISERLGAKAENLLQPDENEKKAIKDFVKKSFRHKVRKVNAQTSHYSENPADNSRLDTATPLSNSPALEGTTGNHQSAMPGGLSHLGNAGSNLDAGVKKVSAAQASHQSHPAPLDQEEFPSSQKLPDDSPTSSFGPDFDRGRYPALRRRRGNKYYAPPRTSTSTPKVNQGNLIPFDDHLRLRSVAGISADSTLTALALNQHSNTLRALNDKDHLRLLKAYANQPTALRASQTQLRAASAADNNRTPTKQQTALELLASIDGTASRRFQEGLLQRGVMDTEEMPFGNRGHTFPHLTKFPDTVAINQLAQQLRRKTGLEATIAPKEPRPSFRPKPATALDPSLEHVVAVLVTDISSQPINNGKKYSVTPRNQTQLVVDQNIVKNVHVDSNTGKQKLVRLETKVVDPVHQSGRCISSLLRNRELGLTSRGRHVGTVNQIHQLKSEMIEPWKDWKGASGDVVAVAWSADSNVYAFGAAAHTNIEDIQYNRPCNLLLGNLSSNQIRELPDHRVDRPRPDSIPSGPNANQAVYDACDPKVYETVTSIAFSPTGDRMFTASHDSTVKIWDISNGKHQCLSTLPHEAWVTSVEISGYRQGLFATASKCVKDAVRIYYDNACYVNFSASRAESRPDWKIYPECLRWGPNAYNSHLLLAGFQQWEQQEDLISGGGQLCLWDANAFKSIKVTPSSQSVYAAAWHPTQPFFATGGAPGNNIIDKANTKTVVRTWDVRNPKRYQVEYECPALDMQDITFCPSNSNIVTAGCTNGVSYVWDWRWPDQPLHRLKHGRPLVDLDHTREREEADTGVMLSLWGPGGSLFYTGSSDGMIKAWDVRRHPKDVLISNIANYDVSIQSGAFSPDGNNLLVGDAEGGIHILSSAPCGPRSNIRSADAYIDLVRAPDGSGLKIDHQDDNPGTEGIEAAKSLIESGQLQYHKELGVGQGPNYQGPYATYARKEAAESSHGRLRRKFEKKQPISKRGEKRWDIAIPMTSLLNERKETLKLPKDGDKTVLHEPTEHVPKTVQQSDVEDSIGSSPSCSTAEGALAVEHPPSISFVDCSASKDVEAIVANEIDEQSVEFNTIPESEMVEENYWWDRMGEEEIDLAKAGRFRY